MKTESTKTQKRKALEYCILIKLEDKPLYVSDIIEMVKKSKVIVDQRASQTIVSQPKNENYQGCTLEDSFTNETPNKVHFLWLWTSYLNIPQ